MSILSCDISVVHRRDIKHNEKGECIPFEDADKNSWYLVGAFRSNSDVPSYISRSRAHEGTTIPITLPVSKDLYFRNFKQCVKCDNLPSVTRRVYIVEIEHDGEWHFEAMFSNIEFKVEYLKHRAVVESNIVPNVERRFYSAELPYNKEHIISVINKDRSDVIKKQEAKSLEVQKEKEKVYEAIARVSRIESNTHRVIFLNIIVLLVIAFIWLMPIFQ